MFELVWGLESKRAKGIHRERAPGQEDGGLRGKCGS